MHHDSAARADFRNIACKERFAEVDIGVANVIGLSILRASKRRARSLSYIHALRRDRSGLGVPTALLVDRALAEKSGDEGRRDPPLKQGSASEVPSRPLNFFP